MDIYIPIKRDTIIVMLLFYRMVRKNVLIADGKLLPDLVKQ
jgi:hypothetical protein